ncbi:MAG TPA: tetratricopeptide repeat protein [Streptosporangiaceae bacterium]
MIQPVHGTGGLAAELRQLRAGLPEELFGAPQNWPAWAGMLPQVLAVAERFERLPGPRDPAAAGDAAWLLDRAASYLQVTGDLTQARGLFERALAIDVAVHGPDSPEIADGLHNLAVLLQQLGELHEALRLAQRALDVDDPATGHDPSP